MDQNQNTQYLKDLESNGITTSIKLKELLTTCQDPVETIRAFQEANSVQLSSLKPVMKFLDLHGIRRAEYHETVINELTEKMLTKLKSLGKNKTDENVVKLEQQLERCFKFYRVPCLRPIVYETLKQLPKVADRYLKLIVFDKEFYQGCCVSVRQQIWVKNEKLFLEDINPVIDSYLAEKEKALLSIDKSSTNFFTCDTTKSRRQWKQIQELVNMVGEYEMLYTHLVSLIRKRFLESDNVFLCSLRMEILMAMHEVNVDYIVKIDPCHDFAWCLDACIRDKHLDSQQTSRLKVLLDSNRKELNKAYGNMALIAADPHVLHFLCSMAIKIVRDNALSAHLLPREQLPLHLVLKLLALGAHAKAVLTDNFSLQTFDVDCIVKFMPIFTMIVAGNMLRMELLKASADIAEEYAQEVEVPDELRATMLEFLRTDEMCALLWLHFLTEILPTKLRNYGRNTFARNVQCLPELGNKIAFRDPWLHLFVHRFIHAHVYDALLGDKLISQYVMNMFLIDNIQNYPKIKLYLLQLYTCLKSNSPDVEFQKLVDLLIHVRREIESLLSSSPETIPQCELVFIKEYEKHRSSIEVSTTSAAVLTDIVMPEL